MESSVFACHLAKQTEGRDDIHARCINREVLTKQLDSHGTDAGVVSKGHVEFAVSEQRIMMKVARADVAHSSSISMILACTCTG